MAERPHHSVSNMHACFYGRLILSFFSKKKRANLGIPIRPVAKNDKTFIFNVFFVKKLDVLSICNIGGALERD